MTSYENQFDLPNYTRINHKRNAKGAHMITICGCGHAPNGLKAVEAGKKMEL